MVEQDCTLRTEVCSRWNVPHEQKAGGPGDEVEHSCPIDAQLVSCRFATVQLLSPLASRVKRSMWSASLPAYHPESKALQLAQR
jgi:hypothetical protein